MKANPLWQEILQTLKTEIQVQNLRPGDRFVSLQDVCRRFDVSVITARRAFDELEQQGWIKKYKYRGAFIARTHAPFSVKLVSDCDSLEFPAGMASFVLIKLVDEIRQAAGRLGAELQLFTSALLNGRTHGSNILVIQGSQLSPEELQTLCRHNNVVLAHVSAPIPGAVTVRHDIRKGADLAVRHLLELGHRRIGLLLSRLANNWMSPRFEAYEAALRRHKVALDWGMVAESFTVEQANINAAMDRLMNNACPPTAIMASNDEIALGIMDYCRSQGLQVPRDLSLTGFDNTPDGGEAQPGLTSVEPRLDLQAEESLRLLLAMVTGDSPLSDAVIPPELVIRGSTAPPAN